jgi:phosphohistidine phosphatase SixA
MRHGNAVWGDTAYSPRPLSAQGEREADAAGVFLRIIGEIPDVIMHSSQIRSKMTAEHVMAGVNAQGILQKRDDLEEDAIVEEFLSRVVSEYGKTDKRVLAVGHNPFVSRLISLLLMGSKSSMLNEISTGTLFAADSAGPSGTIWTQRFFMPPKLLAKFYDSYMGMESVTEV